ncbi:hypothetical protein Tco_0644594 [Tanacetum coccineum]
MVVGRRCLVVMVVERLGGGDDDWWWWWWQRTAPNMLSSRIHHGEIFKGFVPVEENSIPRPLTSLDEGLYALACEDDVRCQATLDRSFKLIEVYIEHGVTSVDS